MLTRKKKLCILALSLTTNLAFGQGKDCESAQLRHARQFLDKVLKIEGSGERMRELLGKTKDETYYLNVLGGSEFEPGWDVIVIRRGYSIGRLACTRDASGKPTITGEVSFSKGWWLSRENYGEEPPKTERYILTAQDDTYRLSTPLPAPFVFPQAGFNLLQESPYQAESLDGIRMRLKKKANIGSERK